MRTFDFKPLCVCLKHVYDINDIFLLILISVDIIGYGTTHWRPSLPLLSHTTLLLVD